MQGNFNFHNSINNKITFGRLKMKKFGHYVFFAAITVITLITLASGSYAMMGTRGNAGTIPAGGMMGTLQMPGSTMMFSYGPTTAPVAGADITRTMPIGVGSVAMGGNMVTIHAGLGEFAGPMDMYMALYAPSLDPFNIYLLHQDGTMQPASSGLAPWMSGVTSIDQTPFGNVPTSMLPKGNYNVYFMATPTGGNMSSYYFWTTNFVIQ
jgi:hypothetical protein